MGMGMKGKRKGASACISTTLPVVGAGMDTDRTDGDDKYGTWYEEANILC